MRKYINDADYLALELEGSDCHCGGSWPRAGELAAKAAAGAAAVHIDAVVGQAQRGADCPLDMVSRLRG